MQALLHVDQLFGLALHQAAHGDARPAGHDLRHVVGVDLGLEEHRTVAVATLAFRCFELLDLFFELRDLAVAKLRGTLQVGFPLRSLGLEVGLVEALFEL